MQVKAEPAISILGISVGTRDDGQCDVHPPRASRVAGRAAHRSQPPFSFRLQLATELQPGCWLTSWRWRPHCRLSMSPARALFAAAGALAGHPLTP